MGDLPSGSGPQTLDITAAGLAHDDLQALQQQSTSNVRPSSSNSPFYSQLSSIPSSQLRPDIRSHAHTNSPQFAQDPNATSLNMGAMTAALPDYGLAEGPQPQQPARQLSGASTSALVYQLQQNLQVHGQPSNTLPVQSGYGPGYGPGQFQHNFMPQHASPHTMYAAFPSNQQRGPGPNPMSAPYQNYPQQPQYMYYPAPYGAQPFASGYAGPSAQSQAMYGRRPSSNSSHVPMPGQGMEISQQEAMHSAGHRVGPGAVQGDPASMGWMPGAPYMQTGGEYHSQHRIRDRPQTHHNTQAFARPGPVSSIPRGPPRKPKQSGHALWVGNLPPGTTVIALKDHFSRDATKDIESLFLISKSNCAFVNYRTEASCTAAMHRFHDSRFNGVRLVCRLRRSSAPASGVPTGPSAMVGSQTVTISPPHSPKVSELGGAVQPEEAVHPPAQEGDKEAQGSTTSPNKYFIVKSLTLQDLELSVRNGIWATQSHNEEALNKAFEVSLPRNSSPRPC